MQRFKTIATTVLVVLTLIILAQNTEMVEVSLLWASVSMPRAILIAAAVLVGFALGVATARQLVRGGRARPEKG